jgi:hypothetical protein
MSNTITKQNNVSIGGKSFAQQQSITAKAVVPVEVSVPAAQPGVTASGAGTTSGNLTMTNSGHGITTGARLDLYWATGRRRGCVVGTVAGTTVPISGGSGDNLPTNGTAIQAMVPTSADLKFIGDNLQAWAAYSDAPGQITVEDVTPAEVGYIRIAAAALTKDWDVNSGDTNIFAGDNPTKVYFSHNDTTGAKTMRFGVAYN